MAMASVSDRTYFPPLEECLTGRIALLSWKTVASAFDFTVGHRLSSPAITTFLKDEYVLQLLKAPSKAFEPPTPQTRADFDTKTSAINVVPSPNDPYKLDEIKRDVLWLSGVAKISEVVALRIAVLEYRSRPQSHLSGPLETKDVTHIREAAEISDAVASGVLALLNVSSTADGETTMANFEKESSRRQRLLATYLSERRSFMSTADSLMTFLLYSAPSSLAPQVDAARRAIAIKGFNFDEAANLNIAVFADLAPRYIDLLEGCVSRSQSDPEITDADVFTEELQADWVRTAMTEAIHAISLAFQVIDIRGSAFAPPAIVVQWFGLMDAVYFFDTLGGAHHLISELVVPLRSLVCAMSLKLLNIERLILHLNQDVELQEDEDPYLASTDILTQLHCTIMAAADAGVATATPIIFAWTLGLQHMYLAYQERAERRDLLQNQKAQDGFRLENQPTAYNRERRNSAGSIVSIEKSSYDVFLTAQSLERDISIAENLAIAVTAQGRVYDFIADMFPCLGNGQLAAFRPAVGTRLRAVFLDLLKITFPLIRFNAAPVACLLEALSAGFQYWDLSSGSTPAVTKELTTIMLEDQDLMGTYLFEARCRFPYEYMPFVSLCRLLSTSLQTKNGTSEIVTNLLLKTPTLTMGSAGWAGAYNLVDEEANTNSFQLVEDIDLFRPSYRSRRRLAQDERFIIPAGTFGRFVEDSVAVAMLYFEHSALALLAKRLETLDPHETVLSPLSTAEVAEGIALFATLIRAETVKAPTNLWAAREAGMAILNEGRRYLPRTKDLVVVVCDILDGLIQEDLADLEGDRMTAITACLQFLDATLQVVPGRVWSYMARCGLISGDVRAGRLSRLAGSLDVYGERFEFLSSAIKLLASLVKNATVTAVERRTVASANSRPRGEDNPWVGASDKIVSQVCLSIAQTTVDVYENSVTWRFPTELDRSVLVEDVVGIMQKLLTDTYSIGSADSPNSLMGYMTPAARYIVDSFVSKSSSSLRFQPLLATFLAAFQIPDPTLFARRSRIVSARLTTCLDFSTTLLRVANYLDHSSSTLQTQLFQSASLISRLPAIRGAFKVPAITLLGALAESACRGDNEQPPSLLGYLGPQISRSFIQILAQLDRPFDRLPRVVSTWNFFSTIMRSRQQWMANCLLTGKTPREALKGDGKTSKLPPDSLLAMALERLRAINGAPSQEIIAILDLFTSVQNHLPWTVFALQKEAPYLPELRSYVRKLQSPSVVFKADPREAGYQARIAAYIAEMFAMQLYHQRQLGQQDQFAKEVLSDVDYFLRNGVQVGDYNASLHANFAKNFGGRFPGCSADDFKRTTLGPRNLGAEYYYALDFADPLLSYDSAWAGPKGNGFRHEMSIANLNLSLVEAEVALFHAWEYLLLELSACLPPQSVAAKQMLQVAEQCLESNQRPQPPEDIFVRLSHSRASLALTLVHRLAESSQLPRDIRQPLAKISATIYGVEDPFSKEQISYFRTLLKILYVVLRGSRCSNVSESPEQLQADSVAITQQVLTILDRVVARAFKMLVALVHEQDSATTPEDLALVTAVLQACLSMPGVDQCQVQILNIMASFDVLQMAASLFSWADKLADKGDPIYGELALLFLLELSALPTVAEQLAIDGLLGHIISANLAGFMRRDGVSPFSDNVGATRCYGIWSKGILPMLLNILRALGATIAAEVAYVLNQFPNLLKASSDRFEVPGMNRTVARETQMVTLIAVTEIHSLALLTRVLAALRLTNQRDIPEVRWDAAAVLENVEFWLRSRKVLRERLLPLSSRESEWRATKATDGSGCETLLEEKVVLQLEAVRDVLSEDLE